MKDSRDSKSNAFTIFRSAAEEAGIKRENDAVPLESEFTERQITVREAEAFKQYARVLPPLLRVPDPRASESGASHAKMESAMNDEDILARLKVIDRRLRQISTENAASVLASGLANAGLNEQERIRLIAETERILDELDGKDTD